MRWAASAVVSLAVASLSACAFLLDFDELTAGNDAGTSGGSGGSAGAGGTAGSPSGGSGGSGGVGNSDAGDGGLVCTGASECDDGDPCTKDDCQADKSGVLRCSYAASGSVVADGLDQTVDIKQLNRVTLTAGAGRFYMSAWNGGGAVPHDLAFWAIPSNAPTLPAAKKLASLIGASGEPRSAAGLAFDEKTK